MARNDVTIRINARDNASATLKQVAQSSQRASKALDSLSGLKNFAIDTASITAGIAGFEALTTAIHNTIGAVGTFYTSMETNQVGMAGILSSMTTLKGNALDFNTAMGISGSIMKKLNDEALRTAATSEELVNTFRALLGPGLGAGMDVDQIIQLTTTGVNAVKSLGLDGTQLVQELRDLVQGGIQPASSTLATALGLTDKDIEAAKSSSKGLFNFLMERLEGFRQASEYTQNTFKGKFDQIKEGLTRGAAEGFEPIFEAVKAQMGEIGNYLLPVDETTKQIQINPQFINDLQYIANESLIIGGNIKEMFTPIASVGLPAITAFGNALVYVGENIQSIGLGLATWYVLRNISTYYVDITAAATGATTANTALGKAVLSVKTAYTEQALSARQTYTEEMLAAQQAATTVVAEEARKTAARQEANRAQMVAMAQQRTTYAAVQRATQAGYIELANTLQMLKVQYMELGVSAEQAGAMQVQAAKLAKAGQFELAQQVIATQQAHIKNAVAAEASSVAAVTGSAKATTAIKKMGTAVLALTGGWLGLAVAIGYATYQLWDWWEANSKVTTYDGSKMRKNPITGEYQIYDPNYVDYTNAGLMGFMNPYNPNPNATLQASKGGYRTATLDEVFTAQNNEKIAKERKQKEENEKSLKNIQASLSDIYDSLETKFPNLSDEEEKKKKEKEKKLSQSDIKSQLLSEAGAYAPLIEIAAQDAGIAPEILAALVKKESTFNPNAVSPSGQHFGLGQISTEAANEVGVYGNLFDPQTNLVASARYLAKMMNMFGGNLELGLAAYNAGAGNVQDYGGIPPFAETQDYVATIMGYLKGEGLSGTGNKYITQFAKEKAEQLKAFQQLQAELNSKLTEETGTQYQVGMQKINEEIQKYQEQTRKMSNYGIDVSGLNEQIKQLQDLEKNKVIEKWRKSWQDLKDSIAETNSELTGNKLANYSIEYTKQLDKLDSERKEKEKAVMQDPNDAVAKAAVDEWYNQQKELFLKEKNDKVREYLLKEYDLEVEHNKNLIELENNTVEQTNVLNREVLNKKLTYLQTELNRAKLTAQQRIDLENQIYETTRAINEIDSQNLFTAWPVALKEMQRDTTNYVELIESAFDSIEDNITDNFTNMLNGAESFSDGFVDIFENMAKEVQSVVMKQIVQQSIMKPLFSWLGNMMGMGIGGGGDTLTYIEGTGFTFRASGGPVESGSPYIVGEKGKELFIPNTDGTIVPNFKLNDYTATNKVVTQSSTPNVTVNVINQSGQNVTAKPEVKSSGLDNYIINVVIDAVPKNKGGIKDVISAVAGRS